MFFNNFAFSDPVKNVYNHVPLNYCILIVLRIYETRNKLIWYKHEYERENILTEFKDWNLKWFLIEDCESDETKLRINME